MGLEGRLDVGDRESSRALDTPAHHEPLGGQASPTPTEEWDGKAGVQRDRNGLERNKAGALTDWASQMIQGDAGEEAARSCGEGREGNEQANEEFNGEADEALDEAFGRRIHVGDEAGVAGRWTAVKRAEGEAHELTNSLFFFSGISRFLQRCEARH